MSAWRSITVRRATLPGDESCGLLGQGGVEKTQIPSGMVTVMMRVDHVADRLARDAFHRRDDLVVVPREPVVHQNHSLARDIHRHIPRVTRTIGRPLNDVKFVLQFLDIEIRALAVGCLGRRSTRSTKPKMRVKNLRRFDSCSEHNRRSPSIPTIF